MEIVGVSLKKQDHTVLQLYRSWLEMGGGRSPHFFKKSFFFPLNYEIQLWNFNQEHEIKQSAISDLPWFFFVYMRKLVLLKSHNNLLTKMFSENPGKLVLDRDLWDAKNATDWKMQLTDKTIFCFFLRHQILFLRFFTDEVLA